MNRDEEIARCAVEPFRAFFRKGAEYAYARLGQLVHHVHLR